MFLRQTLAYVSPDLFVCCLYVYKQELLSLLHVFFHGYTCIMWKCIAPDRDGMRG